MWLNGRDLRAHALKRRKAALRKVVDDAPIGSVPESTDARLFDAAVSADLEGIVAKRWREPYASDTQWLKVKHPGYSQNEGRWELFSRR